MEQWAHYRIKSIDCLIKFKESHESWAKDDIVSPYWTPDKLPLTWSPPDFAAAVLITTSCTR